MFFLEQQLPAIIQQFYQQLKENYFCQLPSNCWQLLFTKKELRVA